MIHNETLFILVYLMGLEEVYRGSAAALSTEFDYQIS